MDLGDVSSNQELLSTSTPSSGLFNISGFDEDVDKAGPHIGMDTR